MSRVWRLTTSHDHQQHHFRKLASLPRAPHWIHRLDVSVHAVEKPLARAVRAGFLRVSANAFMLRRGECENCLSHRYPDDDFQSSVLLANERSQTPAHAL